MKKISVKNRFKILIPYSIILFISFNVYDILRITELMKKQFFITSIAILILVFLFTSTIWDVTAFYLLFGITMLFLSQQRYFVEDVLLDISIPGSIPLLFKALAFESYRNNILIDFKLLAIKSSIYIIILYSINLFILLLFKFIHRKK